MSYSLFQVTGIELEYMIVSRRNGRVLPLASNLLPVQPGTAITDDLDDRLLLPGIHASNELAAHVVEIKTSPPVADMALTLPSLEHAIQILNHELDSYDACLCPGGMHPYMNPSTEGILWPHGCGEIYQAYDRIFGCKGHGWLNLQSAHLNFPFASDHEFGLLHAAIVLLIPVLPALSASTPYCDGKATGFLNTRLAVYANNQKICPEIAGQIVPEPILTQSAYDKEILTNSYRAIAPFDPSGLLQHEWLNSRGAIPRFDRSAIEIRVLDLQECPRMDVAIATLIRTSLLYLTSLGIEELSHLLSLDSHQSRVAQYQSVVQHGFNAPLEQRSLQRLLPKTSTLGEWWQAWADTQSIPDKVQVDLAFLFTHGSLAQRILIQYGANPTMEELTDLVQRLTFHLSHHTTFLPE